MVLDSMETENNSEIENEADDTSLHRMANDRGFLEMWQGSTTLQAAQKESRTQDKQMPAVGFISDTEKIIKVSWSNIQHHDLAVFKRSEWSPLAAALSAKNFPGWWTQVLNVCGLRRIHHHTCESDANNTPQSISDSEHWIYWNGHLHNPNGSKDDCKADNESNIVLGNAIKALDNPEHQGLSATPNVPGLIWLIRRSMKLAEAELKTVTAMETRRNKWNKKQ